MSDVKIQPTAWNIDAIKYGIKPGDRLILVGPSRVDIQYHNLKGTKENPIKITVTDKILLKGAVGGRVMHFFNCEYIEIDGTDKRLIEITGGNHGITFHDGSNHITIKKVHIHDCGYSGIDITNYPTCDPKTWRGNGYVMEDINIDDCIITDCRDGEGIYIGPSHYHASYPLSGCPNKVTSALEHDARNINVRNNVIRNCGADGIQVGGATGGGVITGNTVENFGTKKVYGQSSGIQANPGSVLLIENNIIKGGTSFGIIVQGRTGTVVRRNRVTGTEGAIMLVARETSDKGVFLVENNTFTDIRGVGVQYYSPIKVQNNVIQITSGVVFKKDGSGGVLTTANNYELIGKFEQLALDASGVPTAESKIPAGVGYADYVKITKEVGTVEVVVTGLVEEVFIVTPTKRIKIK